MEHISEPNDSNFEKQEPQKNQSNLVTTIAYFALQSILLTTEEIIKQKQLTKNSDKFIHRQFANILNLFTQQFTPNYGSLFPGKIQQQNLVKIIKIEKDNLSPKQLPSQHPQNSSIVKDLPEILSQLGSKRLNITNRSSFLKRKSSQISQLQFSANTERKISNNEIENSNSSGIKMQKSISLKKDPLQNFTNLQRIETEDPQIMHLRQKVEYNHKEIQKQKKLHQERLRFDKEKLDEFNSKYGDKNDYAFDFDGFTIEANITKQQRLNYYAMKVRMKQLSKNLRTIYKNSEKNQEQKKHLILNRNISNKKEDQNKSTIQLNSSLQIPTFQRDHHTSFFNETNPSKLKIEEYKRLYGKKYSRYDKNSITIDASTFIDKKHIQQDYFASKRHLKDSTSIHKSRNSSISKDYAPKKFALPKLQGKYKVLDRYEEV